MKAIIIKHEVYEGPDYILQILKNKDIKYKIINIYNNDELPEINSFDLLIIMGGPMGVYDEDKYKWLIKEKLFIKNAIRNGKKIFGICLGAQLIAECLGAKVYKNKYKEIGWFPIRLTRYAKYKLPFSKLPHEFVTFHWHNDTFSLPKGAVRIAQSDACENQGFVLGKNIIGLQFHPEITEKSLKLFLKYGSKELIKSNFIQDKKEIMKNKKFIKENNNILYEILDKFLQ